jgi:hypothetical protein
MATRFIRDPDGPPTPVAFTRIVPQVTRDQLGFLTRCLIIRQIQSLSAYMLSAY